jgi:hypothetical protein
MSDEDIDLKLVTETVHFRSEKPAWRRFRAFDAQPIQYPGTKRKSEKRPAAKRFPPNRLP